MKDMNIAIHKPKKDECNVCCAYKYGNIPEHEYQVHIQRKDEARKDKQMDKRIAEENGDVQVLTMDLQVVLLAPRIYANANYFKTKLCCHNFTLYNLSDKEVACYFWNESEGEVKSNSFTSCIVDYLKSTVDETTNTIIIYSDGCGYQNCNVTLGNALLHFAVRQGKVVIQKFLEKGHTWMEVDSVHSAIENKLRRRQIFWPAEYVEVISLQEKVNLTKLSRWTTHSSRTFLISDTTKAFGQGQRLGIHKWLISAASSTCLTVPFTTSSTILMSGSLCHKEDGGHMVIPGSSTSSTEHGCQSKTQSGSTFSNSRRFFQLTTNYDGLPHGR
ncbi:hypothetical protein V1264_013683 [Littorina saxatilis]|uniref:DUF7869 domain-containing protein n=1 Tax=Littorina saxatilis TaxID=31220 RepID=A0AAN9GK56_9CAEN